MTSHNLFSNLMVLMMFVAFSGQSPRMQKRMKILERAYGKKSVKHVPAVKSKKEKKNIRIVKKTERANGVIVSKAESNEISKRYTAWKQETIRLKKLEKSGSKDARYELRRRSEIRVHLNRVAKIQSLHAYAKRTNNSALLGKAMLLMNDENLRFETAMLEIQSHKGHDH